MRIAFVSRMVNREGGIQTYVWELAKRFAEWGHSVHLYTNSCPELPHPTVVMHQVPMLMSRSYRESQNPWVKAFQIWSYAWISRFMIRHRDYDVVHGQGDSLAKADLRTAHSCHKAWIKFELSRDSSVGNVLRKRFNPLHSIVLLIESYNYLWSGAKKVVSVSSTVKQQILDNYTMDESTVMVIPAGVECAKFATPEGFDIMQFRKDIGVPNGVPLMVFVGWEFRRKGLATVLEAMAQMTSGEPHLLVVGGDQERPYVIQAENLGVQDRVHFVGAHSDIRPFLWGSDLFVFPTRYDPCPVVIPEAMAAGLPVIISRCAGNSEWVEDGRDAILLEDPFDAKELADALGRVLSDPNTMVSMGKAAQHRTQVFEWDRVAKMTLDAYESVL